MPIIVDEVIISVEVGNRGAGASPGEATAAPPAEDRQALVEECVARVLDVLREREER
jgi:hypothetical protein